MEDILNLRQKSKMKVKVNAVHSTSEVKIAGTNNKK